MPHRETIQNAMFVIQSAVLSGILIFLSISTKPSDVYRKIDEFEDRLSGQLAGYADKLEHTHMSVHSLEVWAKETNAALRHIEARVKVSEDILDAVEEKTKDRWTRGDHTKWELQRFGDVLDTAEQGDD